MTKVLRSSYGKSYHVPTLSLTFIFYLGGVIAVLLIPLLIVYRSSSSFWLKENSFREQPNILYKKEALVIIDGVSSSTGKPFTVAWSQDPRIQRLFQDSGRLITLKTSEVDTDVDGKNDYMTFSISVPAQDDDSFLSVRLAFVYDYQLSDRSRIAMQTLALIDESNGISASSLHIDGELRLKTNYPIKIWTTSFTYDIDPINFTFATTGGKPFSWSNILHSYNDRDLRTIVEYSSDPIWKIGRGTGEPFQITGKIRYPEDRIYYQPGALEVLKNSWIQYLSVLLVTWYLFLKCWSYLITSRILSSRVVIDKVPILTGSKRHAF